ncbi:hypothetical protein F4677DRAFT_443822 [Hypoxylon crocopeplum]|nr:hypothetical protein F4677DRAFT_443822 [Hypoxylon crocopeplum]
MDGQREFAPYTTYMLSPTESMLVEYPRSRSALRSESDTTSPRTNPTSLGSDDDRPINYPRNTDYHRAQPARDVVGDRNRVPWNQYHAEFPTRFIRPSTIRVTPIRSPLGSDPIRPTSIRPPPIVSPRFPTLRSPPNNDGFIPMRQWNMRNDTRRIHPAVYAAQLEATGISGNYGGNIFLPENQSAAIPESLSTSLWLTNLPPACTHNELLRAIRGCGKIYATVINPPETPSGNCIPGAPHTTSASKLVFFDRSGVDNLLAKSQAGEFSVNGYVPRVRMNRIKSRARSPGPQCRVLHIEGPGSIVNESYLNNFFKSKFTYELESVLTLSAHNTPSGTYTRQEWRFGSFRCQADSARQAIARERLCRNIPEVQRCLWSHVIVHFGVDPCA